MFEFQRGLKSRGFDVTVLTALPNYPTGKVFPEFRDKTEYWDESEKILRTNIRPFKRRSSLLRMITYYTFLRSSQAGDKKHFAPGSFDIVIATSPPIFTGLAGCAIAKRHKAKLIFDIRDVWPDIAVNMGMISKGSIPERWLDSINNRILKQSDRVLVTNCTDSQLIADKGYPPEKIIKIPNGASLKTFNTIPNEQRRSGREKLGIDDKFVICYSGSFNQGMNDVSSFVPLMEKLKDDNGIVLFLIGDGENLQDIRDDAAKKNLDNIRFLPHQELNDLNITLNLSDMGLIPRKRLHNGISGGLPVKMFECWALSKPVLLAASAGSEERELLENVNGGVAVAPGDIDAMADSLIRMKSDSKLREESGKNGRLAVQRDFSREATLVKLVEILNDIK